MVALAATAGATVQAYCFGIFNSHIVRKLRRRCFDQLLRMEPGYYDDERHSPGELTEFLATKVHLVEGTFTLGRRAVLHMA